MFIGLYRKRLETALIDWACSGCVVMGMPALRMGDGDPPQHLGEFPIMSGPEEEMPVIGHQTVEKETVPGWVQGSSATPVSWRFQERRSCIWDTIIV